VFQVFPDVQLREVVVPGRCTLSCALYSCLTSSSLYIAGYETLKDTLLLTSLNYLSVTGNNFDKMPPLCNMLV
jgi:hypothetical protein